MQDLSLLIKLDGDLILRQSPMLTGSSGLSGGSSFQGVRLGLHRLSEGVGKLLDEKLKASTSVGRVDAGSEVGSSASDIAVLLTELADALERRMLCGVAGAELLAGASEGGVIGGKCFEGATQLGVGGEHWRRGLCWKHWRRLARVAGGYVAEGHGEQVGRRPGARSLTGSSVAWMAMGAKGGGMCAYRGCGGGEGEGLYKEQRRHIGQHGQTEIVARTGLARPGHSTMRYLKGAGPVVPL